jgi:hypothetical protein
LTSYVRGNLGRVCHKPGMLPSSYSSRTRLLCRVLGIETLPVENPTPYVDHWETSCEQWKSRLEINTVIYMPLDLARNHPKCLLIRQTLCTTSRSVWLSLYGGTNHQDRQRCSRHGAFHIRHKNSVEWKAQKWAAREVSFIPCIQIFGAKPCLAQPPPPPHPRTTARVRLFPDHNKIRRHQSVCPSTAPRATSKQTMKQEQVGIGQGISALPILQLQHTVSNDCETRRRDKNERKPWAIKTFNII